MKGMAIYMDIMVLLPIVIPIITGFFLLMASFLEHKKKGQVKELNLKRIHMFAGFALLLSTGLAVYAAWTGDRSVCLFRLVDEIPVYFSIDAVGRVFVTVVSIVWLLAGAFSVVYMKHEGDEKRYFGFFLLLYGVLVGLDFAGNLVTMYLFYELMTLASFPLVLHNGSKEAIMAALKYLFYSMCGAYAGLFGIFVLYKYCNTLDFVAGGSINALAIQGHESLLLVAVFFMLIGFGAKAGMFPLHAWLPTAHPVAPSPASACLSGIIVKSGVLAILRTVYYVVGPEWIRGTWVQYVWMTLTLITVFMGSMLAFREKVFKKRLAYSTVSQISYILFGLSVLSATGFAGALMHTVAHAFIKCGLFLTAGVFLYQFGYTRVEQLKGIGRKMPIVLWCYTFFSLALIGIPPTAGFISKWYLAEGALESGVGLFSWLGPVVLLVSALLTAGYLLPVTMQGFFPGEEEEESEGKAPKTSKKRQKCEPSLWMLIPLIILAVLVVALGVYPNGIIQYLGEIAASVLG